MNLHFKTALVLSLLLSLLYSCKDFIEPSLAKRSVLLLSPVDSTASDQYATSFWWQNVEDALAYRVQIVRPDFLKTTALVLDTLVSGADHFKFTLDPGAYQWRVRAENGSSSSLYTVGSFVIHPSSLKDQQLVQIYPLNNHLSRENSLAMRWEGMFGATVYRLQVDTLNFADTTKLLYNEGIVTTSLQFSFPKDQSYQWRVRAENPTQQSKWSTSRTIIYDHTPPAQVSLSTPANAAQVALPVTLNWLGVQGAKRYRLQLLKSDQETPFSPAFPLLLTSLSYSLSAGTPGELLYWKVNAIDEAGNEGEVSVLRSFTIQ